MKLPNKVYDVLKIIVWIAPSALVFVIAVGEAILTGDWKAIVTAVISGIGTFAGSLLTKSCELYNKEIGNGSDCGSGE